MNMTSRFSLLLGVAGLAFAGCSSPEDSDDGPPSDPPPGFVTGAGQGGSAGQTVNPLQGQGGQTPVGLGGAGGAAPVGAGGSGGAANGGAGGAGGAGNGIPRGTGNAITPVNGRVVGSTNGAGIQGSFYTFSDATKMPPGATTIQPATFDTVAGFPICASGTASQVMTLATPDYERYYGGGIGLTMADPGNMQPALPWSRGNVVGFSFNITGTTIPADFRFKVNFFEGATINPDYCVIATAGANTVLFSDIVNGCYVGGPGTPALAPAALLESIQWQVATNTTAPTPFNFCIDGLTAIVQ